jgi:signal transduction histidine kinase
MFGYAIAPLGIMPFIATSATVRLPSQCAWDNDDMGVLPTTLRDSTKTALIACLVVLLAVFTWFIPLHAEWLHNILHHLNILPFMLAGLWFGWRGALKTILLAAVLQAPTIYRHWYRAPTDAQDQIVELSTFGLAGVIAGVVSDRERMQRLRVEATKYELERLHLELQQNIEQLKKTERLTAAGQLSASLAHEIRNPLASISGAAGILARGKASHEAQQECLNILTLESNRLNKLLSNFLHFARPRLPKMRWINAAEVLQSVTALAQHPATERNISLRVQSQNADLHCDPEQIKQLLLNLLLNAIEASPEGSSVEVLGKPANGLYRMEVRDRGQGISQETAQHVFEPFFTTKTHGTGLGLAIASTIATQHNGVLSCMANDGEGTTFVLDLPCNPASAMTKPEVAVTR